LHLPAYDIVVQFTFSGEILIKRYESANPAAYAAAFASLLDVDTAYSMTGASAVHHQIPEFALCYAEISGSVPLKESPPGPEVTVFSVSFFAHDEDGLIVTIYSALSLDDRNNVVFVRN